MDLPSAICFSVARQHHIGIYILCMSTYMYACTCVKSIIKTTHNYTTLIINKTTKPFSKNHLRVMLCRCHRAYSVRGVSNQLEISYAGLEILFEISKSYVKSRNLEIRNPQNRRCSPFILVLLISLHLERA